MMIIIIQVIIVPNLIFFMRIIDRIKVIIFTDVGRWENVTVGGVGPFLGGGGGSSGCVAIVVRGLSNGAAPFYKVDDG